MLLTSLPFLSHFLAQLPLARALVEAGHDVRFATSEELAGAVAEAGFEIVPVVFKEGRDAGDALVISDAPRLRSPFPYLPAAARVAPALIRSFDRWRPDVIIRDPLELGSCLAAEHAGIPHAVGREGPFWDREVRREMLGDDLDGLRSQLGLPRDPDAEMPYRYLAFAFAPPELLAPDVYVPPVMHFVRPELIDSVGDGFGDRWEPPARGRPFVYCTLGTVFNRRNAALLQAITNALVDEPYHILVTTGPSQGLGRFAWAGPTANLSVWRYVPQSRVLPRCDVVVAHGGFHTVMGALLHGVPMVLLPLGGDQPRNARWCSGKGAAIVLEDSRRDIGTIRRAVAEVLADPSYRAAADDLRLAMTALPPLSAAVELVEQLAAHGRPIVRPGRHELSV